ncbi:hypothetical protein [Pseudofrankia asymbiotica]|uniref:Uncharacterized protein n=1 Tax=Pseudofrankia asymbiotica TaxID=1834516 RepID=A0A1V2IE16_9ACTN|nr:hypothetical protein [Pseudofrankia asymbiotica]ONH31119.1 hypothetical protein BL253_10715 [Pseudofrankia asymbiotica]
MTARAGERRAAGRAGRVPFLALVVTAVVAALLGWVLLFQDRPRTTTFAVVLGSVLVGGLLATLLVRPSPVRETPPPARERPLGPARERPPATVRERPPATVRERPRATTREPPPGPDSRWSGSGSDGEGPRTAQLVLPVGPPAGGAPPASQWWTRDAPAPAPAPPSASAPDDRPTEPVRPAPRDLAALRDSARVVQCPRCGAFRIDVRHTDTGYALRCRVDGHEWTWRPGAAWPVTVVASRRRRAT